MPGLVALPAALLIAGLQPHHADLHDQAYMDSCKYVIYSQACCFPGYAVT